MRPETLLALENWWISLFAQILSIVTPVLGATLLNIAATGDHDQQLSKVSNNIQQLPNVKQGEFFQHVLNLLQHIASLCNSLKNGRPSSPSSALLKLSSFEAKVDYIIGQGCDGI